MSMKPVHHTIVKQAAKAGFRIEVGDEDYEVYSGKRVIASGASASMALKAALAKLAGGTPAKKTEEASAAKPAKAKAETKKPVKPVVEDDEDDDDEDDDEKKSSSIVKSKYKERYKPTDMTCGDDLSGRLRKHLVVYAADGKTQTIDRQKLIKFAKANGVWDPRYLDLNSGMVRMNVANRLRAKVRKGHVVLW